MTFLASQRSWLLDPGLLKLVHQCRRLIHTEFGVKLHLTEEHLEQQLADYARKTRSSQLTRTWDTLTEQVPHLKIAEPAEDEEGVKRNNRGQVIAEERKVVGETDAEGDASRPQRSKRIYRGQVVG
ncbi:hypothetical protein [Marinobacter sp. HL-58]|uniref:hypothetical protein n=1 Tax=Marinobacter sp. HL-58 TaxID=1479237 RepID=UPI00048198F5|nr:hypothetical protein [Marinobacter sp. HL-58]KPP99252.1 MAG: hypothetical protein HLUCCO03_05445 [Marinobacter sp. HL-58]